MKHQLKLKNTDTKQFNAKNTKNSGIWPGNPDQIINTKFTPKNTLQKRINAISVKFKIIYTHILPSNTLTAIMTPVLTDRQLECYDILAIQEPAKRKDIDDVICPGQCSWQAARAEVLGRTCFYINKRIAQARRSLHIYNISDIFWLRLQLNNRIL